MKKVTVVIPTFNRAHCIERSIKSVLNQTYSDFNLLIVDDCSTDNTEEVIRSICDTRLQYIRLERNSGAGGARNVGIKHADTEYIAFQDSDDAWLPTKLEKQIRCSDMHPEYGLIYCKMHIIEENFERFTPDEQTNGCLEGNIYQDLLARNVVGMPTVLLRRSLCDEVGFFDESLSGLEDWEFVLRIAQKTKIGYIEEPLVDVYYDGKGVSGNVLGYYDTRCKVIAMHKKNIEEYGMMEGVLADLFFKAQNRGILQQVKALLLYYMQIYN